MSIYANNPLLRGEAHIRLLRILPGSPTGQIKCIFRTFDIDAAPRYQALSYEWGPKFPSKLIYVTDQPKTIRLNLWSFLSRLKSHTYHDYLWCDAICVDQDNDYERNHQVQLMAQIYRKAQSVLVWLGEEYHNSSSALRTILSISTCMDSVSRAAYLTDRETVWKALTDLSKRRYWTRIWIIQEITVAREVELFCGGEIVSWPVFAAACKFPPDHVAPWASELWAPLAEADSEQQGIRMRMRRAEGRELYHSTMYGLIRSQRRWPIYVDGFETLHERYKTSNCEDHRDRIFALLGIAKEVALQRGFTVDYQKNVEETFISLIAWGGRGSIEVYSRIHFARLAAKAMKLEWPDYSLESRIESEIQRSPSFHKWVNQKLPMAVTCRYLGNCKFDRDFEIGKAEKSLEGFRSGPAKVYVPLNAMEHLTNVTFDIFAFGTSNIFLGCKTTGYGRWTVVTRAIVRFYNSNLPNSQVLPDRTFVSSVFEGLNIFAEENGRYSIELKNVAQFMEILLDELNPAVWLETPNSGVSASGEGSLAKVKKNTEDRSLAEVLERLKVASSAVLTEKGEQRNTEEIDDDESFEADRERLQAESEALAKPRIARPPVDMPKRRRRSASLCISDGDVFLDPFCERPLASEKVEPFGTSHILFLPHSQLFALPSMRDLG